METGAWKENAFIEKLEMILRFCLVVLGIAAFALLVVGTVMRFFGAGWDGYGEVMTLVVFWLYMLGAAYTGFENKYVKNDICDRLIKPGILQDTIRLIRWIVIAIAGIIMCWWGIKLCISSVEQGMTTIVYGVPMIIGYISMAIGMGISTVFHVLYLIDHSKLYIRTYIRKEVEA